MEPEADSGADPTADTLPPAKVLLVDDRAESLTALAPVMAELDVELVRATSGSAALDAMLQHDFAVALLYVAMPDMDGFATAAMIKQHPRCKLVPIIFVTDSVADYEQAYRSYEVGAADCLHKPILPAVMRAKVSVFVELYRQREQIKRQATLLHEQSRRERQLLMERAEAALTASEAQYEATARQAPFGLAVLKSDGTWLKANQRCYALLRCKRGTLPPWLTLIEPDAHSTQHAQALGDLQSGRRDTYRAEMQLARADGTVTWASVTMTRLFDDASSPMSLVMEDVSARKKSEQYQAFLNRASETLLSSLDYLQTLRRVAHAAVPILGDWCAIDLIKPSSHHAVEWVALHRDPGRLAAVQAWRRAALWEPDHDAPRVPWAGLELYTTLPPAWCTAAHQGAWPSALVLAPLLVHGRVLGTLTFGCDAPGRTLSQVDATVAEDLAHRCAFAVENALLFEETQQAVRVRDDFLSVASHELRTPLTPLRIQLQRIVGTRNRPAPNLSPERVREILQRSDRHVQRLASLIDNLLDVSRITSGRFSLDLGDVDMCEVIRDVVARYADELNNSGSTITLNLPPQAVGYWDRLRLDQVITNLVTNAIKYGNGQPITVSVLCQGSHTIVHVRDQGIGVPPEKQSHIFERFERAVPTRDYAGLGLGLFIARQIIDAHGGTIEVSSNDDAGCTFTIDLPQAAAVDAVIPRKDSATAPLGPPGP